MGSERRGGKRRLHIVLSLDNPRQRETWEILSQEKNKTSAVCEAVCGYHKRKSLEETLRSILQDELKQITVSPVPQAVEGSKEPAVAMDSNVLDFLTALQNDNWQM